MHIDTQTIIPRVMDHLDKLLATRRRLLWGISGGGFAALMFGRREDTVIAVNPQTDISRFNAGDLGCYLDRAWGASPADLRDGKLKFVHNLTKRRHDWPRVIYLQNQSDGHVRDHLEPLLEHLGRKNREQDDESFKLIFGDWGDGHKRPPVEYMAEIVRSEAEVLLST